MTQHVLDIIDPVILGERIAETRRGRRLTQQQVADALNLSRSTVIAVEKGERRPRAQELVTLSTLFGRPVSDFTANAGSDQEMDFSRLFQGAAKALASDQAANLSRDIEGFERSCRWYVELEEMVGSPLNRRYPTPYDIGNSPPERAAEEVALSERNRLGLGDGGLTNLQDLLEADVGVRVVAIEMDTPSLAGMFVATDGFGGCIAINARHPAERQQWSAAHAYAHFLTDRERPEIVTLTPSRRAPGQERFAEAFAGHFLMPAAGLARRFAAVQRSTRNAPIGAVDVLTLADLYRVSFQSMTLRLESLRLLRAGTFADLASRTVVPGTKWQSLQSGEIKLDPVGRSGRYVALAAQAYEREMLTEGQLAERLGTDILGARETVEHLTSAWQTADDGSLRQITLDLAAPLAHAG